METVKVRTRLLRNTPKITPENFLANQVGVHLLGSHPLAAGRSLAAETDSEQWLLTPPAGVAPALGPVAARGTVTSSWFRRV